MIGHMNFWKLISRRRNRAAGKPHRGRTQLGTAPRCDPPFGVFDLLSHPEGTADRFRRAQGQDDKL